jgi:membrane protein YdbS with pleckstrin-like domain
MKKPNPKIRSAWILNGILAAMFFTLVIFGPLFLAGTLDPDFRLQIFWIFVSWIVYLIVFLSLMVVGSILYYNSWSYALEEDYLVINFGILWKKTNRVPYTRIQNVNVVRGPILRIFGLCRVVAETAGRSASTSAWGPHVGAPEAWIPGPEEGEEIVEDILRRIKEHHGNALASGL